MSYLKPCPFCGGEAELSVTFHDVVLCNNPKCQMYSIFVKYSRWQTRPIEDALREKLAYATPNIHNLMQLIEKRDAEIYRLRSEIAHLQAELKTTDGLLKEATETIGAVIACCTYNSNDDAKIGIYGIDQNAFTKIDQFITRYNDAVSAGKVSVDVKPVNREKDYQNYNRTNTGG